MNVFELMVFTSVFAGGITLAVAGWNAYGWLGAVCGFLAGAVGGGIAAVAVLAAIGVTLAFIFRKPPFSPKPPHDPS